MRRRPITNPSSQSLCIFCTYRLGARPPSRYIPRRTLHSSKPAAKPPETAAAAQKRTDDSVAYNSAESVLPQPKKGSLTFVKPSSGSKPAFAAPAPNFGTKPAFGLNGPAFGAKPTFGLGGSTAPSFGVSPGFGVKPPVNNTAGVRGRERASSPGSDFNSHNKLKETTGTRLEARPVPDGRIAARPTGNSSPDIKPEHRIVTPSPASSSGYELKSPTEGRSASNLFRKSDVSFDPQNAREVETTPKVYSNPKSDVKPTVASRTAPKLYSNSKSDVKSTITSDAVPSFASNSDDNAKTPMAEGAGRATQVNPESDVKSASSQDGMPLEGHNNNSKPTVRREHNAAPAFLSSILKNRPIAQNAVEQKSRLVFGSNAKFGLLKPLAGGAPPPTFGSTFGSKPLFGLSPSSTGSSPTDAPALSVPELTPAEKIARDRILQMNARRPVNIHAGAGPESTRAGRPDPWPREDLTYSVRGAPVARLLDSRITNTPLVRYRARVESNDHISANNGPNFVRRIPQSQDGFESNGAGREIYEQSENWVHLKKRPAEPGPKPETAQDMENAAFALARAQREKEAASKGFVPLTNRVTKPSQHPQRESFAPFAPSKDQSLGQYPRVDAYGQAVPAQIRPKLYDSHKPIASVTMRSTPTEAGSWRDGAPQRDDRSRLISRSSEKLRYGNQEVGATARGASNRSATYSDPEESRRQEGQLGSHSLDTYSGQPLDYFSTFAKPSSNTLDEYSVPQYVALRNSTESHDGYGLPRALADSGRSGNVSNSQRNNLDDETKTYNSMKPEPTPFTRPSTLDGYDNYVPVRVSEDTGRSSYTRPRTLDGYDDYALPKAGRSGNISNSQGNDSGETKMYSPMKTEPTAFTRRTTLDGYDDIEPAKASGNTGDSQQNTMEGYEVSRRSQQVQRPENLRSSRRTSSRYEEIPKGKDRDKARRRDMFVESYDDPEREAEAERAELKRQRKAEKAARKAAAAAALTPILLPQWISVANLATALKVRLEDFSEKLEELGYPEAKHDFIVGAEDAGLIAGEYGFEPIIDRDDGEDLEPRPPADDVSLLPPRPPVVTIMGHVDHGKTTLLDWLRKSSIVDTEHGGITQHIGAFSVSMPSGKTITFLDTPGHAAFESMRQRGANVTDIVVLVIAAEDSVKPQTVEAIKHAKGAQVPMIVAINKIDRPDANVERVKLDLARYGVEVEDIGGDTQVVCVSGKTGQGMADLEETILTLSEILDMRAETDGQVEGWVIEASLKSMGKVATVLVKRGTLRMGDFIVAGTTWARIRRMRNEAGVELEEAGPGTPVEIDGWREQPQPGDQVLQALSEDKSKRVVDLRLEKVQREKLAADMHAINDIRKAEQEKRERQKREAEREAAIAAGVLVETAVEDAEAEVSTSGPKNVYFIIKGDVRGSVEAVVDSLSGLGSDEVRPIILRSEVGQLSEFDVDHAAAAKGHLISFNTEVEPHISNRAAKAGISILNHNIIYKLIEDVVAKLSEYLPPLITQSVTGEAEVLKIFSINVKGRKQKAIAGCKIRNGVVNRASKVRVMRSGEKIFDGALASLKNVKKDVLEMRKGTECGIGFEDWTDFQEGDLIQCYEEFSQKRYL